MGKKLVNTDDKLIDILERYGPLSSKKFEEIANEEYKIPRSSFYVALKRAVRKKEIKRYPPDWDKKKNVYYYLEHQEEKFKEILTEKTYIPIEKVPYEDRKEHTEKLKKLIDQWIYEFPIVTEKGVYDPIFLTGEPDEPKLKSLKEQLSVEKEALFEDLKNHLDASIFRDWKVFKEKCVEYWEKIEKGIVDEKLMQELISLREDIVRRLKDYMHYSVLPGICKYLVYAII